MSGSHWLNFLCHKDRINIIRQFVKNVNGYILDCGCGEIEPFLIHDSQQIVIGSDITKNSLHNLKKLNFKGELILASASNLPFRDNSISCVVCSEVLDYIPQKDVPICISELNRVGDRLIITVANIKHQFRWNDPRTKCYNINSIREIFNDRYKISLSNYTATILPLFMVYRNLGGFFDKLDAFLQKRFPQLLRLKALFSGGLSIIIKRENKDDNDKR